MPRSRRNRIFAAWAAMGCLLVVAGAGWATVRQSDALEAGRTAYEKSDYPKAAQELRVAAASKPQDGDIQLLLVKTYLELGEHDAAIASAQRAVAINPESSVYHEWLGKAFGEKASDASMFSAFGLARRTHKEFETAVELDARNFSARQALIEFDCSAPGIVGGGLDKAQPHIEQLRSMDASEWHYALGNCRRQKKDFETADEEFQKSLESHPTSAELIYDIGDYEVRRSNADRLLDVAAAGEKAAPADPRGLFYRAVAVVLKKERPKEAERWLREYLNKAPKRNAFPRYSVAHDWLGRLFEEQGNTDAAATEYEAAMRLDSKDKTAKDGLQRLGRK
ncbi:MAG TPA: tetratricopeptide repeat protein [Candidatus Acidoferrum sp.]|nr:tetratricopeptide repeat protein [Candidatus Acidoferrum sp.]